MDWFFSDGAGRELRWVLCDNLEGWVGGAGKEAQKGGHIYAHSDSRYCTPETKTMLWSSYTPIKKWINSGAGTIVEN